MTAVGKDVITGTEAVISCVIGGITGDVTSVVWKTSAVADVVTDDSTNYAQADGAHTAGSQTATLTIQPAQTATVQTDTYTCVVTSSDWGADPKEATVQLNIIGKQ